MPRASRVPAGRAEPDVNHLTVLDERVTLHYGSGPASQLSQPKLAALVVWLVLANKMRVTVTDLNKEMWPDAGPVALPQAITALRKKFGPSALPDRGSRPTYQLNLRREQVDALRFIDGVANLPSSPAPADIDHLLALWQFDPRGIHQVPGHVWNPVFRAVDTIAGRIATAGFGTGELANLARFGEVLRGVPSVRELNVHARQPPRLLIVEDNVTAAFDIHLGDYRFKPIITSIDEFWSLTRKSPGLEGYECALVDQHLTPKMSDYGGITVCEYLRDHTAVPAILMSVAKPPPGNYESLKQRLRLVGLYTKADDGTLNELRDMIAAALASRPV